MSLLCLGLVACGFNTSPPAPSANASSSPPVAMPSNFPADVPIYPKARLAAAASFESSTRVTWGMEWETPDPVTKVQTFYASQMNQGDWTITFASAAVDRVAATFARKSNSHAGGTLAAYPEGGLTQILMSLTSPR